jgi:hypothetical protein
MSDNPYLVRIRSNPLVGVLPKEVAREVQANVSSDLIRIQAHLNSSGSKNGSSSKLADPLEGVVPGQVDHVNARKLLVRTFHLHHPHYTLQMHSESVDWLCLLD